MKKLFLLGSFLILTWLASGSLFPAADGAMTAIGEAQANRLTNQDLATLRHKTLTASFNSLDVVGRPELTWKDYLRKRGIMSEHIKRIQSSNADGCLSCHYLPFARSVSEAKDG